MKTNLSDSKVVLDPDLIDLTMIPPPMTPDEEGPSRIFPGTASAVSTPPTPFADRQSLEAELQVSQAPPILSNSNVTLHQILSPLLPEFSISECGKQYVELSGRDHIRRTFAGPLIQFPTTFDPEESAVRFLILHFLSSPPLLHSWQWWQTNPAQSLTSEPQNPTQIPNIYLLHNV